MSNKNTATREPLYAIFTQDCEQLAEHSLHGGPATWDLGKRATAGFADYLESQGLRATFFIVAQTAAQHRRLFLDLAQRGFELGLHLHPQDAGLGYSDYLGGYTFDEQVRLLDQVADQWAQALGRRPVTFRGGNVSANDSTYPALVATGFRQGSCSSPGRLYLRAKAVWEGAEPFAHHAHKANRLYPGDLEFYEVPVTTDQERRRDAHLPGELRIETPDPSIHHGTIAQALRQQIERKVQPKTIVPFTHNTFDYGNRQEEKRRVLETMVQSIKSLAEERGLALPPCTVGGVHEIADTGR